MLIINAAKFGVVSGDLTDTETADGQLKLKELVDAGVLDAVPADPSVDGGAYHSTNSSVTYIAATSTTNASYSITLVSTEDDATTYYEAATEAALNSGLEPANTP